MAALQYVFGNGLTWRDEWFPPLLRLRLGALCDKALDSMPGLFVVSSVVPAPLALRGAGGLYLCSNNPVVVGQDAAISSRAYAGQLANSGEGSGTILFVNGFLGSLDVILFSHGNFLS